MSLEASQPWAMLRVFWHTTRIGVKPTRIAKLPSCPWLRRMNFSTSSPRGHDERTAVQLGENPDTAAVAQATSSVQGRFFGIEECLEPGKGVPVLQDKEAGANFSQDAAIASHERLGEER